MRPGFRVSIKGLPIGPGPDEPRRSGERFTKGGPPVSSRPLRPVLGRYRRLRENAILLKRIKLIWAVQSPLQKYFRFLLTQITCLSPAVLSHRGAARDRHGRGAGCGGREERIDERAWLADDEVVWS